MRILIVTPVFWPKQDGTVRLIRNIAKGLILRGHTVVLVTRAMKGTATHERFEKIEIFRVPPKGSSFLDRLIFIMNATGLINAISMRYGFDAIHAFGSSALVASVFGNVNHIPVIMTFPGVAEEVMVGFDPGRSLKSSAVSALKLFCLGARHITVPTLNVAQGIKEKIGEFNSRRLIVVPNPIDLRVFIPKHSFESQGLFSPEILTVGNLSYRKGFDILVRAFSEVLGFLGKARLTIVGRGPRLSELLNLVESLEIKDRVRFMSGVSDEFLVNLYNACDMFVLSSRQGGEAFGYALVEAMATQKPVITTATPGPKEIIEKSGGGLLVETENEKDLSSAILKLFQDKELSKEMGRRGFKFVESNFDLVAVASIFEKLYSS